MRRALTVAGLLAALAVCGRAEVQIRGLVTSETGKPVAGAAISFRPADSDRPAASAQTDTAGVFSITLPLPGVYLATVSREGFFRLERQRLEITAERASVQFVLTPVREVFESIEVTGDPALIDPDGTTAAQQLNNSDMIQAPYPNTSNFRSALRLLPGMVQDSRGGIHLHGAAEEQTLYTLDGFNVGDPLTGRLETRLVVEAVQAVDTTSAVASAEFGKGSGGVMAVTSKTGDDKLRYEATNFFPSFENRKGLIVGGWSPRLGVSGPIRRGRAWFSNNLYLHYNKAVIEDLPEGEDRNSSWRIGNLTHAQVNLSPSNIFTAGFLLNSYVAPQWGLSVLDPPETTIDRRQRQWFANFKDQMFFSQGSVLELGYAFNRTFGREIPQGRGIYELTPYGNRGFYYSDAIRHSGRDQVLANYIFPVLGGHQLKGGLDLDRVHYRQHVDRTGIEHYRADLTPARRVVFEGNGSLARTNWEASMYLLDSWRVRPSLLVTGGLRSDWDRLINSHSLSPRAGFTWNPRRWEGVRISGGWALARDAANVRLFARPLDQFAVATYFDPDGTPLDGPYLSVYVTDRRKYRTPRYRNWNLGIDRQFGDSFYGRIGYIRKRGSEGIAFQNLIDGEWQGSTSVADAPLRFDAIYALGNYRRDSYDGVEFTVRHQIRKQYEWMASYVWSRSRTTAVVDVSAEDALLVRDNTGRTNWDSPHRLISWGYLPAPWKWKNWAVAYLTEWHSGFPFSAQDDRGWLVGGANSRRFPDFFELNLHLEWRFVLRGHRWALRGGANNLTSHRNYNTVNSNISSPQYLTFYGAQNRAFNFRIRWLGKK